MMGDVKKDAVKSVRIKMWLQSLKSVFQDGSHSYEKQVCSMVSYWGRFADSVIPGDKDDVEMLIKMLYKESLYLVLNGEWPHLNRVIKTHLKVTLQRCIHVLKDHPTSLSKCHKLLELVSDPWGSYELRKILYGEQLSENDALKLWENETPLLLKLRLDILCKSHCEDLALNVVRVCVCIMQNFSDESKPFQRVCNEELQEYFFHLYLLLLLKFHRLADIVTFMKAKPVSEGLSIIRKLTIKQEEEDAALIWHSSMRLAEILSQYLLVRSLVYPLSVDGKEVEKGTWQHVISDPKMQQEIIKAWCDIQTKCKVPWSTQMHLILRLVVKYAASAHHVYQLINCLHNYLGNSCKQLCVQLFIHALTVDINKLEILKIEDDTNCITQFEIELASKFMQLADLIAEYSGLRQECILTAFSLQPTVERFNMLKALVHSRNNFASHKVIFTSKSEFPINISSSQRLRNGINDAGCNISKNVPFLKDLCLNLCRLIIGIKIPCVNSCVCEIQDLCRIPHLNKLQKHIRESISDSDMNLESFSVMPLYNSSFDTFVKLSEDLIDQLRVNQELFVTSCQTRSSHDIMKLPNQFLGADKVDFSKELCNDLSVVLRSPRWQVLNLAKNWEELEALCENYLQNKDEIKKIRTELKFLEASKKQSSDIKNFTEIYVESIHNCDEYMASDESENEFLLKASTKLRARKRLLSSSSDSEHEDFPFSNKKPALLKQLNGNNSLHINDSETDIDILSVSHISESVNTSNSHQTCNLFSQEKTAMQLKQFNTTVFLNDNQCHSKEEIIENDVENFNCNFEKKNSLQQSFQTISISKNFPEAISITEGFCSSNETPNSENISLMSEVSSSHSFITSSETISNSNLKIVPSDQSFVPFQDPNLKQICNSFPKQDVLNCNNPNIISKMNQSKNSLFPFFSICMKPSCQSEIYTEQNNMLSSLCDVSQLDSILSEHTNTEETVAQTEVLPGFQQTFSSTNLYSSHDTSQEYHSITANKQQGKSKAQDSSVLLNNKGIQFMQLTKDAAIKFKKLSDTTIVSTQDEKEVKYSSITCVEKTKGYHEFHHVMEGLGAKLETNVHAQLVSLPSTVIQQGQKKESCDAVSLKRNLISNKLDLEQNSLSVITIDNPENYKKSVLISLAENKIENLLSSENIQQSSGNCKWRSVTINDKVTIDANVNSDNSSLQDQLREFECVLNKVKSDKQAEAKKAEEKRHKQEIFDNPLLTLNVGVSQNSQPLSAVTTIANVKLSGNSVVQQFPAQIIYSPSGPKVNIFDHSFTEVLNQRGKKIMVNLVAVSQSQCNSLNGNRKMNSGTFVLPSTCAKICATSITTNPTDSFKSTEQVIVTTSKSSAVMTSAVMSTVTTVTNSQIAPLVTSCASNIDTKKTGLISTDKSVQSPKSITVMASVSPNSKLKMFPKSLPPKPNQAQDDPETIQKVHAILEEYKKEQMKLPIEEQLKPAQRKNTIVSPKSSIKSSPKKKSSLKIETTHITHSNDDNVDGEILQNSLIDSKSLLNFPNLINSDLMQLLNEKFTLVRAENTNSNCVQNSKDNINSIVSAANILQSTTIANKNELSHIKTDLSLPMAYENEKTSLIPSDNEITNSRIPNIKSVNALPIIEPSWPAMIKSSPESTCNTVKMTVLSGNLQQDAANENDIKNFTHQDPFDHFVIINPAHQLSPTVAAVAENISISQISINSQTKLNHEDLKSEEFISKLSNYENDKKLQTSSDHLIENQNNMKAHENNCDVHSNFHSLDANSKQCNNFEAHPQEIVTAPVLLVLHEGISGNKLIDDKGLVKSIYDCDEIREICKEQGIATPLDEAESSTEKLTAPFPNNDCVNRKSEPEMSAFASAHFFNNSVISPNNINSTSNIQEQKCIQQSLNTKKDSLISNNQNESILKMLLQPSEVSSENNESPHCNFLKSNEKINIGDKSCIKQSLSSFSVCGPDEPLNEHKRKILTEYRTDMHNCSNTSQVNKKSDAGQLNETLNKCPIQKNLKSKRLRKCTKQIVC